MSIEFKPRQRDAMTTATEREIQRQMLMVGIYRDSIEMHRILHLPESAWTKRGHIEAPENLFGYWSWRLNDELMILCDTEGAIRCRPTVWLDTRNPTILRWASREMERLESEGLVVRYAERGRARKTHVKLTKAGEKLVDELIAEQRKADE